MVLPTKGCRKCHLTVVGDLCKDCITKKEEQDNEHYDYSCEVCLQGCTESCFSWSSVSIVVTRLVMNVNIRAIDAGP